MGQKRPILGSVRSWVFVIDLQVPKKTQFGFLSQKSRKKLSFEQKFFWKKYSGRIFYFCAPLFWRFFLLHFWKNIKSQNCPQVGVQTMIKNENKTAKIGNFDHGYFCKFSKFIFAKLGQILTFFGSKMAEHLD